MEYTITFFHRDGTLHNFTRTFPNEESARFWAKSFVLLRSEFYYDYKLITD